MKWTLVVIAVLSFMELNGQTCCSGGVPVSANLGFQSGSPHVTQLSVSADFNILKTLKSGSETLDDDLRLRTTQSYIVRAAHTWHSRWAAEVFFPIVRQTRRITGAQNQIDTESTFGLGDPVALLMYKIMDRQLTIRVGAGPQIPLGSFTQTNDRGLTLLEDLQPGSGAWDLILMSSLEYSLNNRPSSLIYLNTIYSATGKNKDARNGLQTYEFGNDIQATLGYSDQLLVGHTLLQPGISMRYRHANRDLVDDFGLPGTGGDFVFARLSNAIPIHSGKSSFHLNVELPLWSRVNDTQLVPTAVINVAWYHRIDHNKSQALINVNEQF